MVASGGEGMRTEKLPLPEQHELLKLFSYEPNTGMLIRLVSNNGNRSGSIVGWLNRLGYLKTGIAGRHYMTHRIIWKMVTGCEPDDVDHLDGNRANNRWDNLRSISSSENAKNRGHQRNNTSGVQGVSWVSSRRCWVASISIKGKDRTLGRFKAFSDAVEARHEAEMVFQFHPNHGSKGRPLYPLQASF